MSGKEWSKFVQSLLFAMDLDPQSLAERCDVDPTTVNRWIEDEVYPRPGTRLRVFAAFGCASFEELKQRVDAARRSKRLAEAQEIGEALGHESELDEIVRLIHLVMNPGTEREGLIDRIPFLSELREDARKQLRDSFAPLAKKYRVNLEAVESRDSRGP